MVRPFFTALFATIGGIIPLSIFIYVYSINEKHKLQVRAQKLQNAAELMKKERDEQEQIYQRFVTAYSAKENHPWEEQKQHLNLSLKHIENQVMQAVEIARYENLIDWISHYNFWSVIESIFERRFAGEGPAKQDLERLLQRASREAGIDIASANEIEGKGHHDK